MGTTPSVLTILDEIEARLGNITVANEYWHTINKMVRSKLTPFESYDLPAINYWPTTLSNESGAYQDDKRTLALFIEIHTMTLDEPFTDVAEKLATDGVTALNRTTAAPKVSDASNVDLNDTVEAFIYQGHDYIIGMGEDPWCGCLIKMSVVFHAAPFDMYAYTAS